MSIIVCNLEVPMCWIEYRKAGKSLWEIIFFFSLKRLPKHLAILRDQLVYFFGTTSSIVN